MATWEDNYLAHHGIFGQKWGVRRFQNKDGTLTPEGKIRYSQKGLESAIDKDLESKQDKVDHVVESGNKLVDSANKLSEAYADSFRKAKISEQQKNQMYDKIHSQPFAKKLDKGMFDDEVDEMIYNSLRTTMLPKDVAEKRKAFDKMQDDYWKEVKEITSEIEQKYGNAVITDGRYQNYKDSFKWFMNDVVYGGKLGTSFPAHLSRHFDDYWVNDTDALYEARDRLAKDFSFEEYQKRYA